MSLTKASYSLITGAPVNVMDYGAQCDGTTDDTAAVQQAVTYCIANNKDLFIPGMCLLTASINIDRQVDNIAYDNYFTIFSNSGGGFYVSTAINLFSSSLTYTNAPVTQCIRFQNIEFQASVNTLVAYVLDGNKFLRTQFNGCTFSRIRCLTTTEYTQSIYFFNCNVRRFAGVFFLCRNACYDIKFMGNLVENGAQLALLGTSTDYQGPNGCCFIGNCIEGMSGSAIQYGSAAGISITGNYFESNGKDIDGLNLGGTSRGVAVTGNFYSHTYSDYGVMWGTCSGCISMGNVGLGDINSLSSTSQVAINDSSVNSNVSNYYAAPNSGYGQGSWTPVVRGGTGTAYTYTPISANFTKNGQQITYAFQGTLTSTGTNSADSLYVTSLEPYYNYEVGDLVGNVEVVGSSLSNAGISTLYANTVGTVLSSSNVIPANTTGNSWTVRGVFTLYTASDY